MSEAGSQQNSHPLLPKPRPRWLQVLLYAFLGLFAALLVRELVFLFGPRIGLGG